MRAVDKFRWLWARLRNSSSSHSEDDLAWANERLELTQTATGITSWEWDLKTDDFHWTAGRRNLLVLGKRPPVMKYADVVAAVHADDREYTRRAAYGAVEKNEPYVCEFRVVLPDKSVRWVSSRGKVFPDAQGKPARMLGINMDITARKVAEAALSDSEERFRSTFEHAPVGIAHALPTGHITLTNPILCEMLGFSHEELLTKRVIEIVHEDDRPAAQTLRDQTVAGKITGYTQERIYRRKDGSTFAAEVVVSLVRDAKGAPKYFILVIRDITERRLVAQKMQAAMEAADAANRAKSQFLANVSHEIRTPLTAILGFAELAMVRDPVDVAQLRTYFEVILRNGVGLKALIDAILDLSKIEAGRLELEKAVTSLAQVLEETRALLATRAATKGLALSVVPRRDVPDKIVTDPLRLKQILLNVVDNAIKFTDSGSVIIEVGASVRKSPMSIDLAFIVRDTGIGISDSQRSRLFLPFSQADASTTRQYGGTGLGLVLSRRLARLLGGDLVLKESAPGLGSTFVVTISAGVPEAQEQLAPPTGEEGSGAELPNISGIKVLLVDDSRDSRAYVEEVLALAGVVVEIATDGREGVARALAGCHQLVLMDIQMPEMDGCEATRELRRQGFKATIIALSAHALPGERERALKAGCSDYVAKPVRRDDLIRLVASARDASDNNW